MVDEFLNQDEIDALLSGGAPNKGMISRDEMTALSEVAGIVAGAASNVIGMLAGRGVSTNISMEDEIPQNSVAEKLGGNKVFEYSMQLGGVNSAPLQLLTSERGALTLADLMMGGDAQDLPEEANDLYLSASQEGLSQLVGSALTNLSGLMKGAKISSESSKSGLEDLEGWLPFESSPGDEPVWLSMIELSIDGVEPFILTVSMLASNAKELASMVHAAMAPEEPAPAPAAPAAAVQHAAPPMSHAPQQAHPAAAPVHSAPVSLPPRPQGPPVDVKPVEFAQLGGAEFTGSLTNIDLIVDIPVRVTVELGRTRKTIGEVLSMGPGSVVELNKMAGEPVDVLVNGKLIARGEVVVIDESFGVRVTEIVSKAERIRSMGV